VTDTRVGASVRAAALTLAAGCAVLLASGPRLLLEMGRFQNRWEGRPADPVVCSFRAQSGMPCLGCGGTHALALASRGKVLAAIATNPLGAWAGLVLWGGILLGLASVVSGRWSAWLPILATLVASGALAFLAALFWWSRQLLATSTLP
jgi:hypothetical protein